MIQLEVEQVETWVFDMDNTLYHPSADLFSQINVLMTRFIAEEAGVSADHANALRADYWRRYGMTLTGMMVHHGTRPEAFLERTHALDYDSLAGDPALRSAIHGLPGRKIVHTNGPRCHADAVLGRLGYGDLFEAVFTIEDTAFVPKPHASAHERVLAAAVVDPARAAMVEDDPRNLAVPSRRQMLTIWQDNGSDAKTPDHVAIRTSDLAALLSGDTAKDTASGQTRDR